MKLKFKIQFLLTLLVISTLFTKCTSSKYIGEGQYLLAENIIQESDKRIKNKELHSLIKQQPNKKFLGIAPLYLAFYNLSNKSKENGYLKRIGEAPVLLNYRLARKSASQIELYYKNNGYLDSDVSFYVVNKKHKAKITYRINTGDKYKINTVNLRNTQGEKLSNIVQTHLNNSKIKQGAIYKYSELEEERNLISIKIQNSGYYQFNKEYIYFLADTNQTNKSVDLNIIIKEVEKKTNGTIIKTQHKVGVISKVNIHILSANDSLEIDTLYVNGLNFIFRGKKAPFNLNRISEKLLLRAGLYYNKTFVDKTYQSLSELKNYKKINIKFETLDSNTETAFLSANIFLAPGKKIAYSLEAEATSNPELKEGISGSASLSHYNVFNGAEHIRLTYKGSSNFNNISENGMVLNLTIPSLISPFKLKKIVNKNSRTQTIFTSSISKQQRPEFTRNTITGSFGYKWKTRQSYQHKLSLFNLSYVNFQGDSTDLSEISEYLIAKDYSNHLIPTSSYTFSFNNQTLHKLKSHNYLKAHIESSGSFLYAIAKPLNFAQLSNEDGSPILQENGKPSYTLNLWNNENLFTQYIKASLDYRYYWVIDKKNNVAFRAMGGIVYAFGNTNQVPFHKKFVAGGTNDLRGWKAFKRPTGMQHTTDTLYTGGLKLISSLEYRFNIVKKFKGALFIDAGNVWELAANNSLHEAANFKWNNFHKAIAVDVGFGLRYDFQYFILRTDIGFPIREPNESNKLQWNKVNINDSQLNIGLGYPF